MKKSKFYRVKFLDPVVPLEGPLSIKNEPPRRDYYFGSLAAVYELFTHEQIGCRVQQLWRMVHPEQPYSNSKCTVSQESMYRKKTNRGLNIWKKANPEAVL